MVKKTTEYVKEHKDLKEFDYGMLSKVLVMKDKFDEKRHKRRKELITTRADKAIQVLEKQDNNDCSRSKRRMSMIAIKG